MLDKRLDLIGQGPVNSPFFLFARSVINFQWASVRLKLGYQWDGGWQLRRAFLDIRENQRKFPSFSPNAFYSGAMKVALSTIPEGYKWLGSLFGVRTSAADGLQQLEQFLRLNDTYAELFRPEATFHYLFLKFYVLNARAEVLQYIRQHQLDTRNNHLFTYLAVNLSINNQQSAAAEQILLSRNTSSEYLQTPIWDLELGYARLNHLDDDAAFYLERFLRNFRGRYYVKDVAQKLSWHYYLKDDQVRAEYYRRMVLERGSAESDADKAALREAKLQAWPDKTLLRVRLLNDGGYYTEALQLLQGRRATDFNDPGLRLEFLYRVGRLYDDAGYKEESVAYYKQVVATGETKKEYYAARAALQLGYIGEQRGRCDSATYWFNRCLAMKDHDYQNSLDQKAKAGIQRCKANR